MAALLPVILLVGFQAAAENLPSKCPKKPSNNDAATAIARRWFKKADRAYAKNRDVKRRMKSFQNGAYAGFAAGGGLLVTGVTLLVVGGTKDERDGINLTLAPTPSGVLLKGRF